MSSQSYYFSGAILTLLLFLVGFTWRNNTTMTRVETEHTKLCEAHVERFENIENRLGKLDERLGVVESKVDTAAGEMGVYFKMMDRYVASIVHSPRHRERDELMEGLVDGTLGLHQLVRLEQLLAELQQHETDPTKKFAGAMAQARVHSLIWRMRHQGWRG